MNKKHLIGLIFFASGFSSLIYQAAWQRILTLYYSVENVSTTLIVSVYMLGLGLGAIMGGRLAERTADKLRLYFLIELAIGLFGCISIPFMELVGKNTAAASQWVSFGGMFVLLSVPTMLMGITLPLLTKIFNGVIHNFLHSISYLYFINTLGAAFGVLVTSYILISFGGLDISIYTAASINFTIAAGVLLFRKKLAGANNTDATETTVAEPLQDSKSTAQKTIFFIVFVTGFIAIGYEIIWFRIISTLVKASPYSFSTVLAIYLLGIALGSYGMKRWLANGGKYRNVNKRQLFFTFQVLIALYVLFSVAVYHMLVSNVHAVSTANFNSFNNLFHPSMDPLPNKRIGSIVMWIVHKSDILFWPAIFIFPPTLLMGAGFPLITSVAYTRNREADTVGTIYFYNVLGNVTGGLVTGLFLLGAIGTEYSLVLMSFVGLMFFFTKEKICFLRGTLPKAGAVALVAVLCFLFFPGRLQLYKTIHPKYIFATNDEIIATESTDGVVISYRNGEKVVTFINGMTHGGRPNKFFFYEVVQTLSYKNPKKVLVIGLGTCTLIEALKVIAPSTEITLVELSEALLENLQQIDTLNKLMSWKNVKIHCADGRSFLYRTQEKYDAIFMDPLRTTTSFSNNVYSKEFFELSSAHLTQDGVQMVWSDEFNVLPRTLCTVFPHVAMYSGFSVCSNMPLVEDTARKWTLIRLPEPELSKEIGRIVSTSDAPRNREKILDDTKGYPINTDYRPVCEYFVGYSENGRGRGKMFYDHPLMK